MSEQMGERLTRFLSRYHGKALYHRARAAQMPNDLLRRHELSLAAAYDLVANEAARLLAEHYGRATNDTVKRDGRSTRGDSDG